MHPPPSLSSPSNGALVPVEQSSSRRAHLLVKEEPNEEGLPDVSPAPVGHGQRVYVTEAQIRDLDHSPTFKSETHGEISDGGTPGKNGESDVSRTMDSDVNTRDMSVRRPLRPW